MTSKLLFLLLATAALAGCLVTSEALPTLAPTAPPVPTITPTSEPMPTITPTSVPEPTVTPTPSGPCRAVADQEITIYSRPNVAANVFSVQPAGFEVEVNAQTADGWVGFDPAVAQAANMGVFRLRWLLLGEAAHLEGDCRGLEEVVGPPPGVCFTMPMDEVVVYEGPDAGTTPLATLNPGDYAAALTRAGTDWLEVDLGLGNVSEPIVGWVTGLGINLNGQSCESLPTVTP